MTETATKNAKVVPFQRGDTMRREAAEWLVKLDNQLDRGGLSAADRVALRRWLRQNPEHGQILQRQAELWGDMDVLATYARARPPAPARPRSRRAPAFALATLGALAIVCSGLWLLLPAPGKPGAERLVTTAVGEQREERLADGSRVHLNTDSLITVQFGAGERRVRLLRGEAAFDVAHDPQRPFSVYAHNRIVTALGTRFTVRLGAQKVRVAVAAGKVALGRASPGSKRRSAPGAQPPAEPAREVMFLVQGQRAELPLAGSTAPVLATMDQQAQERAFSWLRGRLIFDDERLATIVAEISRYTAAKVTIAPELGDIRLSGRFKTGDTEALLEALELARADLTIHRDGAGDTVYIATRP